MTTILIILAALAWLACGYAAMALYWGLLFQILPSQDTTLGDLLMSVMGAVFAPVPVIMVPILNLIEMPTRWVFLWDWPRWLMGYRPPYVARADEDC